MKIKKTNHQANFQFLLNYEIKEDSSFKVVCKHRQTREHMVRQINTKTTYFRKND